MGLPSLIPPSTLPSISPPLPVLRTLEDVTSGRGQVVSEGGGTLMGIRPNEQKLTKGRRPEACSMGQIFCLQ